MATKAFWKKKKKKKKTRQRGNSDERTNEQHARSDTERTRHAKMKQRKNDNGGYEMLGLHFLKQF